MALDWRTALLLAALLAWGASPRNWTDQSLKAAAGALAAPTSLAEHQPFEGRQKPLAEIAASTTTAALVCPGRSFEDVFGSSFEDLPGDFALRNAITGHKFKKYRVITLDPKGEGSSALSRSWVGSLWLSEPPTRKAVLMALVKVMGKTVDNWAYLNPDGSISKKLLMPRGEFLGVLTIAPSGTVLFAFDVDGDRVVDMAEILAADGRQTLWIREDHMEEMVKAQNEQRNPICAANVPGNGQSFEPGLRLPASANANEVVCESQTGAPEGASEATEHKSISDDLLDERCKQVLEGSRSADTVPEAEILAWLNGFGAGTADGTTAASIVYDHVLDSVFLAYLGKSASLAALEEVEPAGPEAPADAGHIGEFLAIVLVPCLGEAENSGSCQAAVPKPGASDQPGATDAKTGSGAGEASKTQIAREFCERRTARKQHREALMGAMRTGNGTRSFFDLKGMIKNAAKGCDPEDTPDCQPDFRRHFQGKRGSIYVGLGGLVGVDPCP